MIKLADEKDIFGIYSCIKDAKKLLKENGSDQWQDTDGYPNMDTITNYVNARSMYVNVENNEIVGCIALCHGEDISYKKIEGNWLNDEPYYTLHLMAVKNGHYKKGIASLLIKEMMKIAYADKIYNLKVDTKTENIPMTKLLEKLGFVKTGIIDIQREGVLDPKRDAYQIIITEEMVKEEINLPSNEQEKKSFFKTALDFIIKTMNGMAYGLFSTLIIGTIISTIGSFIPEGNFFHELLISLANALKYLTGIGIGLGVAWSLKIEGLKMICLCVAGGISSYFSKIKIWEIFELNGAVGTYFAERVGFSIGDPLSIYVVVIITLLLVKILFKKKTPIDIIIIPLITLIFAGGVSVLINGPISYLTTLVGNFVNEATEYQPLLMSILIAVVMGMALTAPISSAAIAATLGLSGLAGGASVIGCAVQMLGFAVMSRKDNNIGTVISVAFGTSMLQFKNILKKPVIWLPTIFASAILGPIGTMIFQVKCNSSGAGMGTSGLAGIFGTIEEMGGIDVSWIAVTTMLIVAPIILVFIFDVIFRSMRLIKKGDLKI